MSTLIAELKRQHVALVEQLDAVKTLGIGTAAGQAKLLAAKTLLLAHLKNEDDRLYPVLKKAAAADASLAATLATLGQEMTDLAAAAMRFFQTYAAGGSSMDFARDFGKLAGALTSRIRREESTLYPAYDRAEAAVGAR